MVAYSQVQLARLTSRVVLSFLAPPVANALSKETMAASAAYAGVSSVFALAVTSRGCMAYLDTLRQSLDPSIVGLFLDRDMLYAHARLLCVQFGGCQAKSCD